jgi:hypothetical protein
LGDVAKESDVTKAWVYGSIAAVAVATLALGVSVGNGIVKESLGSRQASGSRFDADRIRRLQRSKFVTRVHWQRLSDSISPLTCIHGSLCTVYNLGNSHNAALTRLQRPLRLLISAYDHPAQLVNATSPMDDNARKLPEELRAPLAVNTFTTKPKAFVTDLMPSTYDCSIAFRPMRHYLIDLGFN